LQEISDLVHGWLKACFETLREEPDPDEAGYYCAWIDAPEIDGQRLSLLIGDCLQAFRSGLDQLALEVQRLVSGLLLGAVPPGRTDRCGSPDGR
jgi:hypothetical protein